MSVAVLRARIRPASATVLVGWVPALRARRAAQFRERMLASVVSVRSPEGALRPVEFLGRTQMGTMALPGLVAMARTLARVASMPERLEPQWASMVATEPSAVVALLAQPCAMPKDNLSSAMRTGPLPRPRVVLPHGCVRPELSAKPARCACLNKIFIARARPCRFARTMARASSKIATATPRSCATRP
ncbi:MAG: hypothetical protein RL701_5422 [Pseudomonadota bacterium]